MIDWLKSSFGSQAEFDGDAVHWAGEEEGD
jgi:hypothetical protein